jgi:hypothetical protein
MPARWVDAHGRLSPEASEWIADVFGIIKAERGIDLEEAACYERLRKAGVIR